MRKKKRLDSFLMQYMLIIQKNFAKMKEELKKHIIVIKKSLQNESNGKYDYQNK